MKRFFHLTLVATAVCLSSVFADPGSVLTNPMGFVRISVKAGETTPIGITVLNPTLGGGSVVAVSGSVITLNHALPAPGLKPGYLEVTDQESLFAGDRFDVVSVSGPSVTVDTSAASYSTIHGALPEGLVGATLVYREHVTLGQLEDWLAEGSSFVNHRFARNADTLTLYRSGVPIQCHYGSDKKWMTGGNSDGTGVILAPGEGLIFHRHLSGGDIVFVIPGLVRTNDFRQNLARGLNLLATGFPFDVTFEERGFIEANGFKASRFAAQADQIFIQDENGSLNMYFLKNGFNWGADPSFRFDSSAAAFLQKQQEDNQFYSPQPY